MLYNSAGKNISLKLFIECLLPVDGAENYVKSKDAQQMALDSGFHICRQIGMWFDDHNDQCHHEEARR